MKNVGSPMRGSIFQNVKTKMFFFFCFSKWETKLDFSSFVFHFGKQNLKKQVLFSSLENKKMKNMFVSTF